MSLGREIAPAVVIGRPRFRYYPGPPTAAIVSIPFLALTLFGYLTFRAEMSPGFYSFTAWMTAFVLVMAVVTTVIWLRFGVTISLRELGVVIVSRGKTHEIRYADIDAITIYDKRRYDETATVRALTRTITLETATGKVKAEYVALPQDALDDTLDAIVERVAAEPRPRAGKGWSIEHGTLTVRRDRVPLSSISAAGVFERNVRLWKHNDEEHFFSVPHDTKNARVLLALAQRSASTAPAQASAASSTSSGIGRLLFSRRTTLLSGLGNTILVIFGLAVGWMCLEKYLGIPTKIALGAMIAVFVLWIFYSIYRATVRYRFHERALVRLSLLGTRTLAYANVAAMTWHESAATLEHAIPLGTTLKAKLLPDDGSRAVSIRIHRFRGRDGDLEPVRSHIAHHIAHTLQRHLEHGDEVQWTPTAKFKREGLEVKGGWLNKTITLLPYEQPIGVYPDKGFLVLYRESPHKPLAMLNINEANFYPGLALFEMLMQNVVQAVEKTA